MKIKKNIKLGNKLKFFILNVILIFLPSLTFTEESIISTPLVNVEKIKPSFEEPSDILEKETIDKNIKEKSLTNIEKSYQATLIGLDKITAKSSKLIVNFNESKTYGPLEIKILKCGKVKVNNKIDDVAYLQVVDTSKSQNEKVFIFNGWTFASDPSLTPFDHAIYDLQLLNCYNA